MLPRGLNLGHSARYDVVWGNLDDLISGAKTNLRWSSSLTCLVWFSDGERQTCDLPHLHILTQQVAETDR